MTINKSKMDEIFGGLDKSIPVAIISHFYPDPDSLGSAAGMSLLLKTIYGLDSKILAGGSITHPQNKTLKNILHIPIDDIKNFNPDKFSAVVVLDTDLVGTGLKDKISSIDLRLDHHLMHREEQAKLSDVRICGSASTIVWEYLNEFGVKFEDYPVVCTSLVIGIITDTSTFTSQDTGALDIDAFRCLVQFADKAMMSKILKYPLPKYSFDVEMRAFKDKDIENTILFTYLQDVSQHRDSIATIADRFIRIDGVESVIIAGLVNNDLVFSIRSEDAKIDVDSLIASVFGRQFGGGKDGSGGAAFPLGRGIELISDKKIREAAIGEIVGGFKKKLFEVLGETVEDKKDEDK